MYLEFFGLTQPPFRITPDTDFFFSGAARGPTLDALAYAITHGEGITKVVGEVGSGKTFLCRMLEQRLPRDVEIVYLAIPTLSPEEAMRAIAADLGLRTDETMSRQGVFNALQQHLLTRHSEGVRVVLFVEEAQAIPISTLEQIRLLSNLETAHEKLLQIVLFGQPELDRTLRRRDIRQLRERITHGFWLPALTRRQTAEYVEHRLRAAGYAGPSLVSRQGIVVLHRTACGLIRRVNILMDKALLAAYAEQSRRIRLRHLRAAIADSEFATAAPRRRFSLAAAVVLLLASGLWLGQSGLGIPLGTGLVGDPALPPPPIRAAAAATEPATPERGTTHDPAAPAHGGVVNDRITETLAMLRQESNGNYSVQIMALREASKDSLEEFLQNLSPDDLGQTFVYRTEVVDAPGFGVLYGTYRTLEETEAAIEDAAQRLRVNRPYLRTLNGLRRETGIEVSG